MTVFATKTAFMALGVQPFNPSAGHMHQDCAICVSPLAVHTAHITPAAEDLGYHAAVRITACGHLHGKECLEAWLDTGFTCPTCKRWLFEDRDEGVPQGVKSGLLRLSMVYGEAAVMSSVARVLDNKGKKDADMKKMIERQIMEQNIKDGERQMLGDSDEEDFFDSDASMFEEEYEEASAEESGDEDGAGQHDDEDEDAEMAQDGEVEEMRELGPIADEALEDWAGEEEEL